MIARVLARLGETAATLLVVAIASFLVLRLAPGGPFDQERSLAPEVERALERHYGLDLPLVWNGPALAQRGPLAAIAETQLGRYLGGLARGDLGPSYQLKGRSVGEVLAAGLPASASVGLLALQLAVVGGIALGALAALWPASRTDRAIQAAAAVGLAVPSYVLAALLAAVFGVWLRVLPIGGWGRPEHLLMPAIALAVPHAAVVARLARTTLLSVLEQPFIRCARAKGLSEAQVLLAHALRPALVPVVQVLGPAAAGLLTGSLAVEAVFHVPGVGAHFVNAALNRDYPLVMGTVLLYATALVLLNAVCDVVTLWLDPRARREPG